MLKRLNEYKEMITIIVFFLSGFVWLDNQFPTKTDLTQKIGTLDCRVDKYMTLTQLQIRGQDLFKQIQEKANHITERENFISTANLSPAMNFEFNELKSEFEYIKEQYRNNKTKIVDAMDQISRNVCKGSDV